MIKFPAPILSLSLLIPSMTSANLSDYIPSAIQEAVIGEAIIGPDGARQLDAKHSCFGGDDFSIYFKGKCNYHELAERMQQKIDKHNYCVNSGDTEVQLLFGVLNPKNVQLAIEETKQLCKKAMDKVADDSNSVVEWNLETSRVTNKGHQFDKEYYDGNTYWNEEYETEQDRIVPGLDANVLERDAEVVDDLYETVAERIPMEFPTHLENFEDCKLRAAMCCWVSDRQANDNNGNCAKPYDSNCVDADPADNTDLCAVDMARSGSDSIHVNDGIALFRDNTEGPVHCHGFAWGLDEMEADARYKGNNLFYVSMYDHMYQRGYVRNVPGAPMCGCVEKMPVVSRSDCTEIDATEVWKFSWNATTSTFDAELDRADIEFNACVGNGGNNNLERFYQRLLDEGRTTAEDRDMLRKTIVGDNQCGNAIKNLMFDKGYEQM